MTAILIMKRTGVYDSHFILTKEFCCQSPTIAASLIVAQQGVLHGSAGCAPWFSRVCSMVQQGMFYGSAGCVSWLNRVCSLA